MKIMKKAVALLMVLVLFLGCIPWTEIPANASINVETFATVKAGETMVLVCRGSTNAARTNLGIDTDGNAVAHLTVYNRDGTEDVTYIEGNFTDAYYMLLGDTKFELVVVYGTVIVSGNYVFTSAPIVSIESNGCKGDHQIKPNLKNAFLSAGDTVDFFVSALKSKNSKYHYYVEQDSEYDKDKYEGGYYSDNEEVATVSKDGQITAVGKGTANIYMVYKFGFTSSTQVRFYTTCQVKVVGDFGIAEAYEDYYAEGNDKYFRVIDLSKDDGYIDKVDIQVDKTYNTGNDSQMLITFPDNFKEDVVISKEGYIPQTLDVGHYGSYNWVTLHQTTEQTPVITSVLGRSLDTDQWTNLKLQSMNIVSTDKAYYIIDADVYWGDKIPQEIWLQSGSVKIPMEYGTTGAVALTKKISGGEETYICARSADGTTTKTQILLNVMEPQTYMITDFGEDGGLSATYTGAQDGINQMPFSIKLGGNLPFEYTVDADGKVKGTIGVNLAEETRTSTYYSHIKEVVHDVKRSSIADEFSRNKKVDNLVNDLKKDGCDIANTSGSFAVQSSVVVLGYAEGKLVNGRFKADEVGVVVKVSVGATITKQSIAFVVPHYWELQIKAELELPILGVNDAGIGKLRFTMPEVTFTIQVSGGLHLGYAQTKKLMDLGLVLEATVKIEMPYGGDFSDSTWTLDSQIKAVASLGPFEINPGHFDLVKDYKLYEPDSKKPDVEKSFTNQRMYTQMKRNLSGGISLEVLNSQEDGQYQILASDVYHDANPKVIQVGDRKLMVWLADKTDRTAENRSCLYYAFYDPATDQWTTPKTVMDDGTSDQSPSLQVIDGTVYLLWSKASRIFEEGETLSQTAQAYDIFCAQLDTATDSFTSLVNVSGNNGLYDAEPMALNVDGTLYVVWRQNSANDVFGMEGTNSILFACQNDGQWTNDVLAEGLGCLSGIAVFEDQGKLNVYFAADTDGDYGTDEDTELFSLYDGVMTQITDNDVADYAPFCFDGQIYYYEEDVLVGNDERITPEYGATGLTMLKSDDGNVRVILYTRPMDNNNVYAIMDDGHGWSDPVAVTDVQDRMITKFIAELREDQLVITAVARQQDENGELTQSDIIRCIKALEDDLELTDARINAYTVTAEGTVVGTAQVTNSGMTTVEYISITVSDEEGNALSVGDYEVLLQPGDSTEVNFLCDVADVVNRNMVVSVSGRDVVDLQSDNDSFTLEIYPQDISVENVIAEMDSQGNTKVVAFVVNRGLVSLEDIELQLHLDAEDGDVIGNASVAQLEPGSSAMVTFTTDAVTEGQLVYVRATELEKENLFANNAAFSLAQQPQFLLLEEDIVEEPEGIPEQMEIGQSYCLMGNDDDLESASSCFVPETSGYYQLQLLVFEEGRYPAEDGASVYMYDGEYKRQYPVRTVNDRYQEDALYYNDQKQIYYLQAQEEYSITFYLWDGHMLQVCWTAVEQIPPQKLSFTEDELSITEGNAAFGGIEQLELIYDPEGSFGKVEFTSSDETVVTVDDQGYLSGIKAGTAVITATVEGCEAAAQCTVTVEAINTTHLLENVTYESPANVLYSFTPIKSGFHHVDYSGNNLFWYSPQWDTISHENNDCYMEAGKTYYLLLEYWYDENPALTIRRYPDLAMDRENVVQIPENQDAVFNVCPSETWQYAIYSVSDVDDWGSIYDRNMERLAYNDDYNGRNFRAEAYLEADTYYLLKVGTYSGEAGEVTLYAKQCAYLTALELLSMPDRTQYVQGFAKNHFRTAGLELRFTWSDGTVKDWSADQDSEYFEGKWIEFDLDQLEQTGLVTIGYGDQKLDLQLNVIPNPVKSICLLQNSHVVYYENAGGYYDYRTNDQGEEEEYYYYFTREPAGALIQIQYLDGTTKTASVHDVVDGYEVEWEVGQYEKPWVLGSDNQTVVSYLGHTCNLPVTVAKNPVLRLEIASNTVQPMPENAYGSWSERYVSETDSWEPFYYYSFTMPDDVMVKIVFTDGTSRIVSLDEELYGFSFDWDYDQEGNPWTLGSQNYVNISFMGHEVQLPVTIVKNPLEKIELISVPSRVYEYGDTRYGAMGYSNYQLKTVDLTGLKMRLIYTDGTTETVTHADIQNGMLNGYKVKVDQWISFSGPGTRKINVEYLGQTVTFDLQVVASPVASLEILKGPDKTHYQQYLYPFAAGTKVKIIYTDGTSRTVTATDENLSFRNGSFVMDVDGYELQFLAQKEFYADMEIDQVMTVVYRGVVVNSLQWFTFDETWAEEISVSNVSANGDGMQVNVTFSDGTKKEYVLQTISWDSLSCWGYAKTSDGILNYGIFPQKTDGVLTGYGVSIFDEYINVPLSAGVAVSGKMTSYGTTEAVMLELWKGSTLVQSIQTTDGSYALDGISAGAYTLKVSKKNHVTRTYTLSVNTQSVTQDVKICLLGDVTGDGRVNVGDTAKLYGHIKKTSPLTDEYVLLCADSSGDGRLNIGDVAKIYAHAKGSGKLW